MVRRHASRDVDQRTSSHLLPPNLLYAVISVLPPLAPLLEDDRWETWPGERPGLEVVVKGGWRTDAQILAVAIVQLRSELRPPTADSWMNIVVQIHRNPFVSSVPTWREQRINRRREKAWRAAEQPRISTLLPCGLVAARGQVVLNWAMLTRSRGQDHLLVRVHPKRTVGEQGCCACCFFTKVAREITNFCMSN